jgi:RHS repeat-associated protein
VSFYDYDGFGRRSWVAFADGKTQLNAYGWADPTGATGRLLFSEHSHQGQTRYVYLGGKLIAEHNAQAGVRFAHTDALGSPVAWTSPNGSMLAIVTRYEPYGATAEGPQPASIGFTGHVNDGQTGLVYMQQRYYDPIAGRFLSVDPVTTNAKTGDFFGRYHYANNNPYKFKDPDGRAADLALDLVFIAADLVDIGKNGLNLSNGVSLAGNLVGAAIPFATGLGKLASTAVTAGKVADTTSATRSGALAAAKEANGIPRSAQPDAVIKPGTPAGNAAGLDSRNVRQYEFTNSKGEKVSIREDKAATYPDGGSQSRHFNAGPSGGKLEQHHYIDDKKK